MFPLHEPLDELLRAELSAYDDFSAALLARRGIATREEAARFLNPSYDEHLHDPLLMTDMPKAAARLAKAIANGERIAAWTDYDCDGGPAAVLLHDFLAKAGATFENYIPHRHLEGYGVNEGGIEKLASRGVSLVVTADVGITDAAAVARANELGMDVIVTDHHLPGDVLPPAYAVVDPKAHAGEPYPFKELCGAGIAWKLVCATLAVDETLRARIPAGWEKWLLDMAGLATIADMVPLIGENRVLASYGLRVMRKSPRAGLQKLCRSMRVDQRALTEDDVGFMIAPRVNAASRMGDARDVLALFTTADESEADALAKKLEKANRERKAHAGAITRAVRARLAERREMPSVIALGDPQWRPALLGLVANTIAEEHGRPVFLWGREGNMSIKGSVRSGSAVHALELMRAAEGTFVEFGGHAASGGFTVRDDAVFSLEDRLVAAYARIATSAASADELTMRADAELALDDASLALLEKLERFAPFGVGNPKPVFLIRDGAAHGVSRFGKGQEHLKVELTTADGARGLDAVAFFAKGPLVRVADALVPGASVHLLAHLERDTFSRTNPLRLRLLDMRLV
ncbi:MAG TPA: single-stranded-DNA-specific exonuclease RecJ [Candidatus Paceibacterota bacterium]|nr:single-stranded-DNA-specific exonuclease RecJ [Candidatus Paceibacterota bacterium]